MSLVFAGVCSHAPGITGRAHMADPAIARRVPRRLSRHGASALKAARPDALVIVVAAEHFANFFMNNMPAFAVGMADHYEGPIEDPEWLGIRAAPRFRAMRRLSLRLIREMMQSVDLAYAEEWKFDHGIMVPLHFLTPELRSAGRSGEHQLPGAAAGAAASRLGPRRGAAPRRGSSCRSASPWSAPAASRIGRRRPIPARSTRPGTGSSCAAGQANDKAALLSYTDEETYRDAGQGGFEIRTFISRRGRREGPRAGSQHYRADSDLRCRMHGRGHEHRRDLSSAG